MPKNKTDRKLFEHSCFDHPDFTVRRSCIESEPTPPPVGFYVYALVDPRDRKIFYVGKGSGRRFAHHRSHPVNALVAERISDLETEGQTYAVLILADSTQESDALRIEREWIGRLPKTCNISPGQLGWQEKRRAQCRAMLNRIEPFETWITKRRSREAVEAYRLVVGELERQIERPTPDSVFIRANGTYCFGVR